MPGTGRETDFERSCRAVSRAGEQQGKMPDVFKLQETPEIDPGVQRCLMRRPVILPPSASRNEVRIHFTVLGGEFQGLVRRNPISGPGLNRLPFTPDRIP